MSLQMKSTLWIVWIAMCFGCLTTYGQELGFVEQFALSKDREATLQKLVPGTEDYYFFHSLHYLNTQQFDKVQNLMEPWLKRRGKTELYRRIEARLAIMKYDRDPNATIDFLKRELGVYLAHQREIPQAERNLPTRLDQKLISPKRLVSQAQARYQNFQSITDYALEAIDQSRLNRDSRRHLLNRIRRPDFPGLVKLVAADLKERNSGGFGSLGVHNLLTLSQLRELVRLDSRVAENDQYVNALLWHQRPSADVNVRTNREAYHEYLKKLENVVKTLGPKFNSLKANVLYHQLVLDQKSGIYDEEKFRRYLELPRQVFYVNRDLLRNAQRRGGVANLSANYSGSILTTPIRNDEQLVRDYLQHFFRKAESYSKYEPLVRTDFLKENFATAKILSGIGDVERWASLLSPAAYKDLVSRVDIEFAPTNAEYFQPGQAVKLKLNIKNVDKLIVKVFEINTFNYYRKLGREIDTDINLDGLIANSEKTYEYDAAPAHSIERQFEFGQINKPGVYVIDFIGNGKSSRALVRIGRLSLIENRTMAGHAFRVVNHAKTPVKDYSLWIRGQRFEPNENGLTVVPFSTQPGRVPVIVSQDDFSCLDSFDHAKEVYGLKSALVVDRESLKRNEKTFLVMRPQLTVSGIPTDLDLLKDVSVTVNTMNLDGNRSTRVIEEIQLGSNAETLVEFRVPPRMQSVEFKLSGTVENISQGKKDTVSVSRSYVINQIDRSNEVQDVHLVPHQDGFSLEVLGKSGEPRPKQAVAVELFTDQVNQPVKVNLQSDAKGRIELGGLANVKNLTAQIAGGSKRSWSLRNQLESLPRVVHREINDVIDFPAPIQLTNVDRNEVKLFEIRNGRYHRDVFKALQLANNRLRIKDLDAGDYQLFFPRDGRTVTIKVTDGKAVGEVLVGESRRFEQRMFKPVTITSVKTQNDKLEIQLGGANAWTRVHVLGNRYASPFGAYGEFGRVANSLPWSDQIASRRSSYMSGRKIGDEYKYILDRRYAAQFPGNMLDRPSLLVSPWKVRETDNGQESLASGDSFAAGGVDSKMGQDRAREQRRKGNLNTDFANLDFLAEQSVVLTNLEPNEDGLIEVDRELLGDRQHLRIVVADAFSTVVRNFNTELQPLKARDLRMASGMDPDKNFSKSRESSVLRNGEAFVVEDIVSAKFQTFDDLGDLFRFYKTKSTELGKFQFVVEWNQYDAERKRELYSKFACHELNFFLFHKDKAFFDEVVRPHLEFKRDSTFMDRWLLRQDLQSFLEPRQLARLNTAERILLAQRMEDYRSELVRNVNERYELNPASRQMYGSLFDDALAALPDSDALINGRSNARGRQRVEGLMFENIDKSISEADEESQSIALVQPAPTSRGGRLGGGAGGFGGGGGGFGGGGSGFGEPGSAKPKAARLGRGTRRGLPAMERMKEMGKKLEASNELMLRDALDAAGAPLNVPNGGTVMMGGIVRKDLRKARKSAERLYRRIKKTAEYIENNYWHISPEKETPNLIPVNRFWRDYANHEGGSFLTPFFVEANSSLTEIMFALAVLDLPFEAKEHQVDFADAKMTMACKGNMIVLHQQVQPAIVDRGNTSILVSENFFQKNDRYRNKAGVRYDKFINNEFVAHTLYGGQVVVTNPTSTPQMIDLLVQVPEGALVASGSRETSTIQKQLNAFSTETYEYFFYFPTAGKFAHFPAHVSADEKVLAVANPVTFNVKDRPTKLDTSSWAYVSQNGSDDEVLEFLNGNNILNLDLTKIAFRMKRRDFYERAIPVLRNRFAFNSTLWAYSLAHNDAKALQEFLDNNERVGQWCQPFFQSRLVSVEPVDRRWYYHREYRPLINARAHQVGKTRKILNPVLRNQYLSLMNILASKPTLNDDDELVVTYYLLLQDRIEESLDWFARVDASKLNAQMQYDYCDAYLDMYREKPDAAAKKASKWVSYPVDHWRQRFQNIVAQVEEIQGGATQVIDPTNSTEAQTAAAAVAESFEFELVGDLARLKYQNVEKVTVNYYEMDIELLFSKNPFAQDNLDGFSLIRPNASTSMQLEVEVGKLMTHEFTIPEELGNKNVLVEVVAGDQAKSRPYFANRLTTQLVEKFGQVRVMSQEGRPVAKAYVKVYHRDGTGKIKFHKDGYTDLRGRFDYVSQSNNPLDGIQKYSILILHPEYGAVIRQADPPQE